MPSNDHIDNEEHRLCPACGAAERRALYRQRFSRLSHDSMLEGYEEVPDATGFADWPDAPFQQFSVEHINFFSSISLQRIMSRHGFSLVEVCRSARAQSHGTVMPVVFGIFRRDDKAAPVTATDVETETALRAYIELSVDRGARIVQLINDLAESQRAVLVWGVGTHTLHLMETTRLAQVNILAFIDSNSRYAGQTLQGMPILTPDQLVRYNDPVLISSRVFQSEIENQIRSDLGCANEIIRLYEL